MFGKSDVSYDGGKQWQAKRFKMTLSYASARICAVRYISMTMISYQKRFWFPLELV